MRYTFVNIVILCLAICTQANSQFVINFNSYSPYFAGRQTYLNTIKTKLNKYGKVQINGISGIGKTATARYFSHINKKHYDAIWWINARKNINVQLVEFIKKLSVIYKIPISKSVLGASNYGLFAYIKKKFSDKKILLIIDDLSENQKEIIPLVHSLSFNANNIHTVITSQNKFPEVSNVVLGSLSQEDSLSIICKFFPEESKNGKILASKLNYFPLLISQTLKYMEFNNIDISTYLNEIYKNKERLINKQDAFINNYKEHLAMWDGKHISVKNVIGSYLNNIIKKNDATKNLLSILPFLSNQSISKFFLKEYLQFSQGSQFDADLSIRALLNTGVFTAASDDSVQCHDIVKEVLLSSNNLELHSNNLSKFLLKKLTGIESHNNININSKNLNETIENANSFLETCDKINLKSVNISKLKIIMSFYHYSNTRDLQKSLKYVKSVEESGVLEELTPYYRVLHAAMLARVALTDSLSDDALENIYQNFLLQWRANKNDIKLEKMKLKLIELVVGHLLMRQKVDEAKTYIEEGTKLLDSAPNDYQKVAFVSVKSWYLNEIRDTSSIDMLTDSIWPLLEKSSFGTLKIFIATDKVLALILEKKFAKARKFAEIAVKESNIYFGDRITDTKAFAYSVLGRVLLEQKKYEKSKQFLENSLAQFKDYFGTEGSIIGQIETKLYLSRCLIKMKSYDDAFEIAKEAAEEYKHLIGEQSKTVLAKDLTLNLIKAAWLSNQIEFAGGYIADFEKRFDQKFNPKTLPKLDKINV